MSGRRQQRRSRAEGATRAGDERKRIELSLPIAADSDDRLRRTQLALRDLRGRLADAAGQSIVLDMERCPMVDAGGLVLLKASLDRSVTEHDVEVGLRWPRSRAARFALSIAGFSGTRVPQSIRDARAADEAGEVVPGAVTIRLTSGRVGQATGAQTFEAAKLAENLGDANLADRVHAALNEAADNVLSWAYVDGPPKEGPMWWALGLVPPKGRSTFIALDHGATIPATAPRTMKDQLLRYMNELKRRGTPVIDPVLNDAEVLQATIASKRSQSGLGQRGKGLASMIALIDRVEAGEMVILSGDALFAYRRVSGQAKPQEICRPLGWRFEGTMIQWYVGGPAAGRG